MANIKVAYSVLFKDWKPVSIAWHGDPMAHCMSAASAARAIGNNKTRSGMDCSDRNSMAKSRLKCSPCARNQMDWRLNSPSRCAKEMAGIRMTGKFGNGVMCRLLNMVDPKWITHSCASQLLQFLLTAKQ